jgi:hypothetical protein
MGIIGSLLKRTGQAYKLEGKLLATPSKMAVQMAAQQLQAAPQMASDALWAVKHPIGRLQNKGPFTIQPGQVQAGTVVGPMGPLGGFATEGAAASSVLRGQALEQAVREGTAVGGKVTSKIMSPKALAEYKAKLGGQAGKASLKDQVEQHGQQGLLIPGDQAGLDKLLTVAKHPGHSNTTFYPHDGPPAVAHALRGAEKTTTKYVVTEDGKIGVGDLGMHHDQIMQRMGVKNPKNVIQGELHHAQPDLGIKARVFTGRSIMNDLGVGQAKQNATQTAAIHDWLSKGAGESFSPVSGAPTHARGHISMGGDIADNARARALTKRLASEPNPLDNPAIPSALQVAGKRSASARNEASRVGGGPTRPQDYEPKPKLRTAAPAKGGSVKVEHPDVTLKGRGQKPIIKVVKDRTDPRYGRH